MALSNVSNKKVEIRQNGPLRWPTKERASVFPRRSLHNVGIVKKTQISKIKMKIWTFVSILGHFFDFVFLLTSFSVVSVLTNFRWKPSRHVDTSCGNRNCFWPRVSHNCPMDLQSSLRWKWHLWLDKQHHFYQQFLSTDGKIEIRLIGLIILTKREIQ